MSRAEPDPAEVGGRTARAFAGLSVRFRFVVIAGWTLLAAGGVLWLPSIADTGGGGLEGIVGSTNPAIAAEIRGVTEFGFPLLSRTAVVQHDPEGLSGFAQARVGVRAVGLNRQEYDGLEGILGALPVTNTLGLFPSSSESGTTAITYLFTSPTAGFAFSDRLARQFADRYVDDPDDGSVGVAGTIPARVEQATLIQRSLPLLEAGTVALIALIVAISFRSVVAPLVALVTAGTAFLITVHTVGYLGTLLGVAVPSELEPLILALLLGIVTDYVIFFLSGMRTRLLHGDLPREAVRHSTVGVAPIVLVAGVTVAGGTAALLAAESPLFRTLGPALALTILVSLIVAITLVPALLAVLGRRALWPSRPRPSDEEQPMLGPEVSSGVVRSLTQRRTAAVVMVACVGGLTLAAVPLTGMNLGFPATGSLPASSPVRQASAVAAEGFAPGILSPTVVLVEAPGVTADREALARLQELLSRQPGVAGVLGPGQQLLPEALGVVLAPGGDAARYLVVLDEQPLGAAAIDLLESLRSRMPELLRAAGLAPGVQASFAGDTALASSIVSRTEGDLGRITIAAVLVDLLLLVLFLRALVAPLYLLAASVLAVAASLGLTVFVFQGLLDQDGLTFYVPFAAAVLLVALGSDYNIFGVGHVWQEARRRPLREAMVIAIPQTTRAITAAGVTLALSFAVLVVVPLTPFRELAFAMAVGILIDVFVVRSFLVPSLLTLVGRRSGWPGRQLVPAPTPAADSGSGR